MSAASSGRPVSVRSRLGEARSAGDSRRLLAPLASAPLRAAAPAPTTLRTRHTRRAQVKCEIGKAGVGVRMGEPSGVMRTGQGSEALRRLACVGSADLPAPSRLPRAARAALMEPGVAAPSTCECSPSAYRPLSALAGGIVAKSRINCRHSAPAVTTCTATVSHASGPAGRSGQRDGIRMRGGQVQGGAGARRRRQTAAGGRR